MAKSGEMMENLKELTNKRKNREISAAEYYKGLMSILSDLSEALKGEEISDEDVKKQIPLLKVFLTEQLKNMGNRGN